MQNTDNKQVKKYSMKSMKTRKILFAWSFIIIPLLVFILKLIFINGQSIVLAFKDSFNNWSFVNFVDVYKKFTDPYNPQYINMVKNTLDYFFMDELLGNTFRLLISYFLYKKIKGYKTFLIIFYLPNIIASMVMVIAFEQFVYPGGVFETIFGAFGASFPSDGLLQSASTAKGTLILFTAIRTWGFNIYFYSSMSRIPPEVVEASHLDGVTPLKEFLHITFPLILPIFMLTLLLDCASMLNAGPPILLFGAPPGTQNVAYWFFAQVYDNGVAGIGQFGFMSAVGLVFTLINLPIVFIVRKIGDKVDVEY